jgi:hypothetical protein
VLRKLLFVLPLALGAFLVGCSSAESGQSTIDEGSPTSEDEGSPTSEVDTGCQSSTREAPIGGDGLATCGDWDISVSEATLVDDFVVLDENMFNDVSDDKSWIVVTLDVTYNGEGVGDLDDALGYDPFLIGKNNVTYEDNAPILNGLEDVFGPLKYNASDPYSGGTAKLSMWFWVDKSDSDLVLALFVDDPYGEVPNLWVNVSEDRI